jgi:hypothetical protein
MTTERGMKIRTVQRNSVEMNPLAAEYIVYVQGNRRGTEERRVQRNELWPGGPRVSFYEPHGALIETCEGDTKKAFSLDLDKCVPVLSPDWRQHRSKSQVDAFTCLGRILNLLEELLLPDRIVECRNGLCSTGQISAHRHIQVAEFSYACL